jgi:HTH-type transcriptional regulator, sugar sensing transcriptional regulator
MNIAILKKLGFSDKEIRVYLTLMEYGAMSVRGLAELSEINRGTAYDILKKLQEKGLVNYFQKDSKQKFVAEDPEKLLQVIENQKDELEAASMEIGDLIPELRSMREDYDDSTPSTKLFEGRIGIRLILDDLLSTLEKGKENEREYYIYSATASSEDINEAYPDFTKKRIKAGIRVKSISLAKGGQLNGLDERRWLATDEKSATFILVYRNKCAFISRDKTGAPVGVIIENKNIYETQRVIFGEIWKFLEK